MGKRSIQPKPYNIRWLTCATLALANRHMDVVAWFEDNGVISHNRLDNDVQQARQEIHKSNPGFKAWID